MRAPSASDRASDDLGRAQSTEFLSPSTSLTSFAPRNEDEAAAGLEPSSPASSSTHRRPAPRISFLTSLLLYCGYAAALFISFNVLRIAADTSVSHVAPGSISPAAELCLNSTDSRQCAAPHNASAESPSLPLPSSSALYMERWSPLFASAVVLAYSLALLRVISLQAKRVASLATPPREAEGKQSHERTDTVASGLSAPYRRPEAKSGRAGEASHDKSASGGAQRESQASGLPEGRKGPPLVPDLNTFPGAYSNGMYPDSETVEQLLGLGARANAIVSILKYDVRAPLKGSLGLLQLLLNSSLDPMQQDFVHTVQSCARGLIHTVNNIVDAWNLLHTPRPPSPLPVSSLTGSPEEGDVESDGLQEAPRPGAEPSGGREGGMKIDSAVFELRSIVDEVLAMFGSEACEKGLEIASLVMDSVPSAVLGDPLRLRQILMNLFAVAVRLTEGGHVFLCVRLAADETELKLLSKRVIELGKAPSRSGSPSRQQQQHAPSRGYQPSSLRQSSAEDGSDAGSVAGDGDDRHSDTSSDAGITPEDTHAARAGRGQKQIAKGESLTLSGRPAVDGSNSWQSICGMLREQEERFQRLMKSSDAVAKAGAGSTGVGGRVRLVFSLEDTGVGMPPEVVEAIDNPLAALDPEQQPRYAAVPLFMSLSKRLVEAMGGTFMVQSTLGVGTTVTFDISLAHATKIPGGSIGRVHHLGTGAIGDELHPELAGIRAKLRGLRCLVVDGRPVRQQITATYMARLGLRVDLSDSAPAAALALRHARNIPGTGQVNKKSRWDIVVVDADCDGPGTGIELGRMVQQLKEMAQPWEKSPVLPRLVLVAQTTNEEMEAEAGKHGYSCIMLKPLRATSMATALLQALGLNPSETTAMALKRRQILLRLCLKGKKVLVVDHVFMTRKAAAVELSRFAEVCLAVESAQEAIQRLQDQAEGDEFSLILVNMHLADMPGPEFVDRVRMMENEEYSRELKKKGPQARLKRTPTLGLVAESAGDSMARWRELDVDGLMSSPIEEAQLFGVVTKIFREPDKA